MAKTRVLIVESDDRHRIGLTRVLADVGYMLEQAHSVSEAARLLTSSPPPDAVIANAFLCDGTVVDLMAAVTAVVAAAEVPVIVVTSIPSVETIRAAAALGVAGFMLMPFTRDELVLELGRALRGEASGLLLRLIAGGEDRDIDFERRRAGFPARVR